MVMHLPSPGGTRPLSMSLECTWGPKMVKEATCFLCFLFLRLNIFVGGMAGGLNVLLTGGRLGSVVLDFRFHMGRGWGGRFLRSVAV